MENSIELNIAEQGAIIQLFSLLSKSNLLTLDYQIKDHQGFSLISIYYCTLIVNYYNSIWEKNVKEKQKLSTMYFVEHRLC